MTRKRALQRTRCRGGARIRDTPGARSRPTMAPLSGVSPVDQRRIAALLRAALDHLRDGAPLPADAEPFVKHALCYQPPRASALLPAPLRRALERSGEQLVALNAYIDGLQEAVAACAPLIDDGRVTRELVAAKQSVSTVLKVRLLGQV